ncbi:hypothetical protein LCGC14_1293810 [marine sediment metagenome]|uniref:Uncharacterized protein n=1 Tax=marine sediment metagenome TaxID=412755 RepID=A0A0F9N868_9ZZZZ
MGKKFLFNPIEGTFDIVAGEDDYLQASKENDQINFNTGDEVIFDTVDMSAGSAISLNTSTGIFTLSAGKTYKLTCGLRFEYSSSARIGFQWYNITDSVAISMLARIHTMSSTNNYSNLPVMQCIITPDIDTQVSVRCTWEGDGVEDVNAGYTWAIVEKISETFPNVTSVEKEWTEFIPSVDAVTTAPTLATTHKKKASYKVVGKSLHIIWSYSHIWATGATGGSGDYLIPIPAGYTIDTSKVDMASVENTYAYGTPIGHGRIMQDTAWGELTVVIHDNTNLRLIITNENSGGTQVFKFMSNGFFAINVNNQKVLFTAEIPIITT